MSASEQRKESSLTQEAADWHARLRSGSLSAFEETRFRAWLAGDPERRREFDEMSALLDQLGSLAQSPEVLEEQRRIAKSAAPGRTSRRAFMGWALAASVATAVGFVGWQRMFAFEAFATGVGEQRTVPLGDGSLITLNTSSHVNVRFSGGQRRVEIVHGQANFQVAKDATRPFVVSGGGGEVVALGTEFDVYQRADDIVVTLIEGRVAVVPSVSAGRSGASLVSSAGVSAQGTPASLDAILLSAGEQVTFGAPGHAPLRSNANLHRVSAWRNRKLDFADTPLAEAITEANRYSRQKIELRAPEFANEKISGVFDAGENEQVAEGMGAYFRLQVELSGDGAIVLTR